MDKTAPEEEQFLPREPLDLPKPHEMLPEHTAPRSQQRGVYNDVQTLLSWHAPGRPFRKRKREYFINILIIMLSVEVILFLFSQYLLMVVIIALIFLNYSLSSVPPHDFRYKISTEGIMFEDYFYLWQELYDFYFKQIHGVDVLIIRTKAYIPGELIITLGEMQKEHLKSILLGYLPFREYVRPTFSEKSGDWLSKTFPLEKSPHNLPS